MEPKYDNMKGTGHLPADERARLRAERAARRARADASAPKEPGVTRKDDLAATRTEWDAIDEQMAKEKPAHAPSTRHTRGHDK